MGDIEGASGFDFVSSNWVDWKAFPLHSDVPELTPKLRTPEGDEIFCHGYISGRFLPNNLLGVWIAAKVFVVDTIFSSNKQPQKQCHFLFCNETLSDDFKLEGKLNTCLD